MTLNRDNPADLGQMLMTVDGDKELVRDLIDIFVKNYEGQLDELNQAIQGGDTLAIEKNAHKLKGTVINFSARQTYDIAVQIERYAKQGMADGIKPLYKELSREFDVLIGYLLTVDLGNL